MDRFVTSDINEAILRGNRSVRSIKRDRVLVRSGKSIILNLFAKLARHCVSPLASLCFHSFFLSRCDAIESEGNGTSMKRWKKTPRFRYVRRVYINATFVCIILENWAKVGCSIEKLLNRLIFILSGRVELVRR